MDAEGLFTIVFILALLSIPFGLGFSLSRSIRKRKQIENLYASVQCRSGRVVGYTDPKYDPDIVGDHYIVVEYMSDQNEAIWAEAGGRRKADHPVNSVVVVMCDPHDKRRVTIVFTQNVLRLGINIEKNLGLAINLVFTGLILATVFQYHGIAPKILIPFCISYAVGLLCGAVINTTRRRDDAWTLQDRSARTIRLKAAQQDGIVPCYLKE